MHRVRDRLMQRRTALINEIRKGARLMAVEKTLRLESTKRFPLFHRRDDEDC